MSDCGESLAERDSVSQTLNVERQACMHNSKILSTFKFFSNRGVLINQSEQSL